MNWNLDITIEEPYLETVAEDLLRSTVEQVMKAESVDYPAELSLLITGDEAVHELNLRYRKINSTTDVLAFALQEGDDFPGDPEGASQLGEVIISCPQADRQAEERGHSLKRELSVLVIHGVLHLLGYDHETDGDAEVMEAHELQILQDL